MRGWMTVLICLAVGCGTTKWTDTARTATEQLLISDAMDRAVSRLDFRALAGKKVFLDDSPVKTMVDSAYLVSVLRQQVLASGAILKEKREEAEYIMEIRAGAIGTDNHSVLFGVPATNLPTVSMVPAMPTQIPEIALIKRTEQRAVAKLYMFVYNRETGRPLWQSGAIPEESHAKATWVFGAGPFQQGNIYNGTKFAFDRFDIPLVDLGEEGQQRAKRVAVADEAFFVEPKDPARLAKGGVDPKASAAAPAGPTLPPAQPQPTAATALQPGPSQTSHLQPGPGPGPRGPEVTAARSRWIVPDDSAPTGRGAPFEERSRDRRPPPLDRNEPWQEPLRDRPREFDVRPAPYDGPEGDWTPWPG
jgi:hypothetical protein